MTVLAIDPGPELSAWVLYRDGKVAAHAKQPNKAVLFKVADWLQVEQQCELIIEQIAAMGMAVGAEVFETCFWSGRFAQAWSGPFGRVKRHEVKMHLCGHPRAKDPNIRQALIDRFGPGKEKAIGTKRQPGPLYGLAGDEWSALAVAVTWADRQGAAPLAIPAP